MTVTMGIAALGRACQLMRRSHGTPFAVAARMIRRIVVDQLKRKRRRKRGGRALRLGLGEAPPLPVDPDVHPDLLALEQALDRLGESSPESVQVVELRYFAGLSIDEVAAVLEVGRATVVRRWRFARAWLREALTESS